jgi:U3 small nucleolar RNA-associated protein 25
MNNKCFNVAGRIKARPESYPGTIADTIPQLHYTRIPVSSLLEATTARFTHFTKTTFPSLQQSALQQSHTCIFINNYFDFVRARNWFEKMEVEYAAMSEYTSDSDISRARSDFFHGRFPYLLVTERFHFFRR